MSLLANLRAHYKMKENAASTAVVDATGNFDGVSQVNTSIIHVAKSKNDTTGWVVLKSDRPLVTFTFDDGYDEDYTIVKPLFDAQGIVGCTAIVTDEIGNSGRLDSTQILALQAAGWEIMSHSIDHPDFTGLNEADLRTQLSDSKDVLEGLGCVINNIAYPYGLANALVRRITREYYRSGRGVSEKLNYQILSWSKYAIRSYQNDNYNAVEMYKGYVDDAIAENKWLTFYSHSSDADYEPWLTLMNTLIDYIQAEGIDIVTIDQALNRATLVPAKVGGAFGFNGSVDHIEIPTMNIGSKISMCAWVLAESYDRDGYIVVENPVNTRWGMLFVASTNKLVLKGGGGTALTADLPTDSRWHFIVGTISGNVGKIYIDGILVSTGNISSIGSGSGLVDIGRYDSGCYFMGVIGDVMIINRDLTQAEVSYLNHGGDGRKGDFASITNAFTREENSMYSLNNSIFRE